jgi:hypothetical protein
MSSNSSTAFCRTTGSLDFNALSVDLIDKTIDLAAQAGGIAGLKKLVDRPANMRQ